MSSQGMSAEVHFAQRLAGNEKKTRDKAVRRLKKWLEIKSASSKGGFSKEDLMKIWKGLHYCMWMSDKPLIQEELASSIASLVHSFQGNSDLTLDFIQTFFQTEAREWSGIDRWRIDKFMMMIRRFLSQSLVYLRNTGWKLDLVTRFTDLLSTDVLDVSGERLVPDGLKYHLVDVYTEELTSVGAAQLTEDQVFQFLKPFFLTMPHMKSQTLLRYVIKHLFEEMMEEETARMRGEVTEEEEESPRLKVDYVAIGERLFEVAQHKSCLPRNRPVLYQLVTRMKKLGSGNLLTEVPQAVDNQHAIQEGDITSAMKRLSKLDDRLYEQSGVGERKRKRKEKIKALLEDQGTESMDKGKNRTENTADDPSPVKSARKGETTSNRDSNKVQKLSKKQRKALSKSNTKVEKPKGAFEADKEKLGLKKKKSKLTSNCEISDDNSEMSALSNGSSVKKTKKKRKSLKSVEKINQEEENNAQDALQEEVEIWIPNKKYKGKLSQSNNRPKGNVGESDTVSPTKASTAQKPQGSSTPFAYFAGGGKTPPAFVRKAYTKLRTPQTMPVKKSRKVASPSPGVASASKKRVSFDMQKNTSLDFDDSIVLSQSPATPFNPSSRPDQSILKSPPGITSLFKTNALLGRRTPSKIRTPTKKLSAGKKQSPASQKRRPTASDFF